MPTPLLRFHHHMPTPLSRFHPQTRSEQGEAAEMASLGMGGGVAAAGGRAWSRTSATGRNGGGGGVEEKGPLEWLVGLIRKDEQLLETDPILKKVEDKGRATSVSVPSNATAKNKFPGLGALFPRNN